MEQNSVSYNYPSQVPLYGEVEPSPQIEMEIQAAMKSLTGPAVEDCEHSDPHYQQVLYGSPMYAVPITHHNVTPSVLPVYNSYTEPDPTPQVKEMPLSLLTRALSKLGKMLKHRPRENQTTPEPHVDFYKFPTASSYVPSGYETYSVGENTSYPPPPVYPANPIVPESSSVYLQQTPPPGVNSATRHPVVKESLCDMQSLVLRKQQHGTLDENAVRQLWDSRRVT